MGARARLEPTCSIRSPGATRARAVNAPRARSCSGGRRPDLRYAAATKSPSRSASRARRLRTFPSERARLRTSSFCFDAMPVSAGRSPCDACRRLDRAQSDVRGARERQRNRAMQRCGGHVPKSLLSSSKRSRSSQNQVPKEGLEPSHPFGWRILSPLRLPFRHFGICDVRSRSYLVASSPCSAVAAVFCCRERGSR